MYSIIFTARKRTLRRLCFYTCLSVILFKGGVLSQHALQVLSQHALQQVSRGGVSMPTPNGEVWGGSGPGPQPRGKLREIWPGGVCSGGGCLLPGVCLRGSALGEVPALGGVCSRGACSTGGVSDPPLPWRLLLRAVRILLECILVETNVLVI